MVENNDFEDEPGRRQEVGDGSNASRSRFEKARHAVGEVSHRARQRAAEAANVANQRVTHSLDSQKDRVASRLSRIATSIRDSVQCFADNDEEVLGQYVELAADRLEDVGDYLQEHTFDDLRHETATFLRRHPEVGLAGAFIGGLLIARFLRASSTHDSMNDDGEGVVEEPALAGGYEGSSAGHWGAGHSGYAPGRGVITPVSGAESSGPSAPGHAMARGDGAGKTGASAKTARSPRFDLGDES